MSLLMDELTMSLLMDYYWCLDDVLTRHSVIAISILMK